MSYGSIDRLLRAWALKRDLHLVKEEGEIGRRVAHTSSSAGETFQIVIEPERNKIVRIDAHLIETNGIEEVHYTWEVPVIAVQNALEICSDSIHLWFNRNGGSVL